MKIWCPTWRGPLTRRCKNGRWCGDARLVELEANHRVGGTLCWSEPSGQYRRRGRCCGDVRLMELEAEHGWLRDACKTALGAVSQTQTMHFLPIYGSAVGYLGGIDTYGKQATNL
eukprot:IDg11188t1